MKNDRTMVTITSDVIQSKVDPFLSYLTKVNPEIIELTKEYHVLYCKLLKEEERIYRWRGHGLFAFPDFPIKYEAMKLLQMSKMGDQVICSYTDVQVLNNLSTQNIDTYIDYCKKAVEYKKQELEKLTTKEDYENPYTRLVERTVNKSREDQTPVEKKEQPNIFVGILFITVMGMIVITLTSLAS